MMSVIHLDKEDHYTQTQQCDERKKNKILVYINICNYGHFAPRDQRETAGRGRDAGRTLNKNLKRDNYYYWVLKIFSLTPFLGPGLLSN